MNTRAHYTWRKGDVVVLGCHFTPHACLPLLFTILPILSWSPLHYGPSSSTSSMTSCLHEQQNSAFLSPRNCQHSTLIMWLFSLHEHIKRLVTSSFLLPPVKMLDLKKAQTLHVVALMHPGRYILLWGPLWPSSHPMCYGIACKCPLRFSCMEMMGSWGAVPNQHLVHWELRADLLYSPFHASSITSGLPGHHQLSAFVSPRPLYCHDSAYKPVNHGWNWNGRKHSSFKVWVLRITSEQ